jgi:multidrug efflux pump subunit AcrA (membrane-fusion protein)
MLSATLLGSVLVANAIAQDAPEMPTPVSYASMNQLNGLLSQLEQTSQTTQVDLAKLRIDKWKIDANTRRQTQGNTESIEKNLQSALPEIINQLRASPEDLAVTFKLYRNLSALYDVFSSVAESAGAFGSKDDFQSLDNDLSQFDQSRRNLGDRMNDLATAKDAELKHLRSALQTAQTALAQKQQQKVVVDNDDTSKKSTPAVKKKKKPAPKPASTTTKPATTPATNSSTPAAQPNPQSH